MFTFAHPMFANRFHPPPPINYETASIIKINSAQTLTVSLDHGIINKDAWTSPGQSVISLQSLPDMNIYVRN